MRPDNSAARPDNSAARPDNSAARPDNSGPDPDERAPGPELTGVASVDAALERLRDVGSAPLDEHVEIFDDVQRQLHDALAELDDE